MSNLHFCKSAILYINGWKVLYFLHFLFPNKNIIFVYICFATSNFFSISPSVDITKCLHSVFYRIVCNNSFVSPCRTSHIIGSSLCRTFFAPCKTRCSVVSVSIFRRSTFNMLFILIKKLYLKLEQNLLH